MHKCNENMNAMLVLKISKHKMYFSKSFWFFWFFKSLKIWDVTPGGPHPAHEIKYKQGCLKWIWSMQAKCLGAISLFLVMVSSCWFRFYFQISVFLKMEQIDFYITYNSQKYPSRKRMLWKNTWKLFHAISVLMFCLFKATIFFQMILIILKKRDIANRR